MQSINIHVGLNLYLWQLHADLCFDKFAPLNLHSLRRRLGCIVVLSKVDSSFYAIYGKKKSITFLTIQLGKSIKLFIITNNNYCLFTIV